MKLDAVHAFASHIVLSERTNGLDRISVMSTGDGGVHEIAFPDPVYTAWVGPNAEYETTTLRYGYTSLVAPATDVDYDMNTRNAAIVRVQPVLGGYDASQYTSAREWAIAPDGTRVPISLVYRHDTKLDGTAPAHALRLRLVRALDRPDVSCVAPVAARPRVRLRDRAHPRRRRDGSHVVRAGPARTQDEHVHRLHRVRRAPGRAAVHLGGPARDSRRQRGRAA